MSSKEYRVEWTIDICADTPQEAARIAMTIQRDANSTATVFSVKEHDSEGDSVQVDLSS